MIQWEPSMETRVSVIDKQHKMLVARVNELVSAMKSGKGRELIGDTLVFLGKYALDHFATEEAFMRQHSYPEYDKHKAIHEAFKQDFGSLAKEFDAGEKSLSLTVQVQHRIADWLRTHILQTDQELGRFLRAKGAA